MNPITQKLYEWFGGRITPETAEWIFLAGVFVVATTIFWLVARMLFFRRRGTDEETESGEPRGLFAALAPALAEQIPESEKERQEFAKMLRQAGMYHPDARTKVYALRFLFLIVPIIGAGIWVVWANDPAVTWRVLPAGIILGAALSIVPRLYVWQRRRRRLARIRRGLPDTIDMLSMCISGGLGLSESLEHVCSQLSPYPELAQELAILRRQAEVGSLKFALADFVERVDLPEARQLATLLLRGARLGTQLAGSLNEQADHLRIARRQLATTAANKTPVKLVFPLLFCLAPSALLLLLSPAAFDLYDYIYPRPEAAATAQPGEAFGTRVVIRALQQLEQKPQPLIIEGAPTMPEPMPTP
ncbi:MAG: type II secretion system F family protein [Thermoguttaceae bacterium]|nr:type II secretion system F family protein [Thermoguttaceae bacterium]MDW8038631.1 type II secretion system F family protein [Thermoguttaceae bacterium]